MRVGMLERDLEAWQYDTSRRRCRLECVTTATAVLHLTAAECQPWTESSFSTNLNGGTLADERTFRSGMNMFGHSYCR